MDIKNLLDKELQAAEETKKKTADRDAELEQEAARLFQPIASAMEQLKSELSSHGDIKFSISNYSVTIRLGEDTKLEPHRYRWSHNFVVDETHTYKYPEYDIIEQKHEFDDADSVIGLMVKKCAEYVTKKQKT